MNIIISGMTCSGKTTLSNEISSIFYRSSIIHEDDYFKDKDKLPHNKNYYLLDSPNAFNTIEFINDINIFLNTGKVFIPKYDVINNKRLSKDTLINKSDINIFEGLHTISLLNNIDGIKIFLDIELSICLERRIKRDSVYGYKEEWIKEYFNKVIIPLYKLYIEPQKEYADYVIKDGEDKKCLLKALMNC